MTRVKRYFDILKREAIKNRERIRFVYIPALVLFAFILIFHNTAAVIDDEIEKISGKQFGAFTITCKREKGTGQPRCWVWRDLADQVHDIYYTFEINGAGLEIHAGRRIISAASFSRQDGTLLLGIECKIMCRKRQDFRASLDMLQKLFPKGDPVILGVDFVDEVTRETFTVDLMHAVELLSTTENVWAKRSIRRDSLEQ